MFEKEILQVLKQVITSWQVIVISIALILYLNIVFFVAKAYHAPRNIKISFKRKKKVDEVIVAPDSSGEDGDSNDDLGLEEE